jgi:outer membrane protein OmpA-like peptidoglycan-associated protein
MHKPLFLLALLVTCCMHCLAGDTTSVTVRFAFNKYSLDGDAQLQLDDVKPLDSSITLTNIKIYGFTDQVGSNGYNEKLSLKRATEVRNYLIKTGINPNIITIIKGKGETELVVDQMDEDSRQQNRRVLVMIEYEAKVVEQTIIIKTNKKKDSSEKPQQQPQKLVDKIKDKSVKAGDQITLPNINFEGGRHVFLPQSYEALTELLNTMKEIPSLNIEIQGHICCEIGDVDGVDMDLRTRDLSVQRARAVYLYLYKNGIDVGRMSYKGFGHKYPISNEETEAEKTINRRVEIKIISK